MHKDTPVKLIQIYFMLKSLFIVLGILLFWFNIPHLSILNFLFEDMSLYNFSIIIPIVLLIGYIYCFYGLRDRSNLARIISIVLCFITFFVFPIGTIISSLIIVYLVFFEKDTFADIKKQNMPYRVTGAGLSVIGIVGLLFLTGAVATVSDNLGLYNVGTLSTMDFDSDSSGNVDVIIWMGGVGSQAVSVQNVVTQDIINLGGTVSGQTYLVANTLIASVDVDDIATIQSNPNVISVIPDEKIVNIYNFDKDVTFLLDNSYSLINVDGLWDNNVTGIGVTVAVVDTGINGNIPALQRNGVSVVVDSFELYGGYTHWHGTACSSCIASQDSIYKGIAPSVDLLDIGVFDSDGGAYTSDIIQGWDWVVNWKNSNDRFVICSNSFGAAPYSDNGLLASAANNMVERYNIPMVVAAGNLNNPYSGSINTPGNAEHVLTVGAVDDNLELASFSCLGPGAYFDHKPDVVALGDPVHMFDDEGNKIVASGTSFSTPITAGAMALLAQNHLSYDAEQFNIAFRRSATDLGPDGFDYGYGYGLINVEKADEMISEGIPINMYNYVFGGFTFIGIGLVSYPDWRKKR